MNRILILLMLSFSICAQDRKGVPANRYELLSGVHKNKDPKMFWDQKYANTKYVFGKTPAKFLSRNYDHIPEGGRVLDMGMGEGRNAVFLARKGFKVTGIDISSVAIKKANLLASEYGVRIQSIVASLNNYNIEPNTYDAILCFYYVDRSLTEKMISWLKPGGVLIYESHTDLQQKVKGSEKYDRRYLLREEELLTMFKEPLHREEFTASIILKKPE